MGEMDQDELTRLALLKANAQKIHEERVKTDIEDKRTNPTLGVSNAEAKANAGTENENKESAQESAEKIKSIFPYELQLGKNKTIRYKNWTGKTKKLIKTLVKNNTEPDNEQIIKILIEDNIHPSNLYLSEVEAQYIMFNIRKVSINEKFKSATVCEKCGEEQELTFDIDKDIKYSLSKYPQEDIGNKCTYVDIADNQIVKETANKFIDGPNYDGITTQTDVEIAMHINKENKTAIEIMDWMDELNIRDLVSVHNNLASAAPSFEIKKRAKCKGCNTSSMFTLTEIPDVFTELVE